MKLHNIIEYKAFIEYSSRCRFDVEEEHMLLSRKSIKNNLYSKAKKKERKYHKRNEQNLCNETM